MNALVIGAAQSEALADLRARAMSQPIDMAERVERIKTPEGAAEHRRQMDSLSVPLPMHFMVTFSYEIHPNKGMCRHMSISSRPDRVPTPEAVWMVCRELGFVGGLDACAIWDELTEDGRRAINAIQPLRVSEGGA